VKIGLPFYTTGDYSADMTVFLQHYKGVKGKFPERQFDFDTIL
jgi:hypothetical protein